MRPASMRRRAATLAALALCMCLGTTSFAAPSFASAPQPQQARTPLIGVHVAVNRKRVTVAVSDDGGPAGTAL
ncbi:hypothetical protein AB0O63_35740, partial [Streptomyces cyaneofuscatus]